MIDPNEVCEEVTALLDRMDKFPEEFLDDYRLDQKWGRIVRLIGDDNNNKDVFTSAELRLLNEKIKGLTRVRMKREILETIMRVEKEEYIDIPPYNPPTGRVPIPNHYQSMTQAEKEALALKIQKQIAKPRNTPEKY
jgi:hypothetical protein